MGDDPLLLIIVGSFVKGPLNRSGSRRSINSRFAKVFVRHCAIVFDLYRRDLELYERIQRRWARAERRLESHGESLGHLDLFSFQSSLPRAHLILV